MSPSPIWHGRSALLDTSILYEIAKRSDQGRFAETMLRMFEPCVCMMTIGESMACVNQKREESPKFAKRVMQRAMRYKWLDFHESSPQTYASVVANYGKNGAKKAKCNAADFWILTCAIGNAVPLLTMDGDMMKWGCEMNHPTMRITPDLRLEFHADVPL